MSKKSKRQEKKTEANFYEDRDKARNALRVTQVKIDAIHSGRGALSCLNSLFSEWNVPEPDDWNDMFTNVDVQVLLTARKILARLPESDPEDECPF